MAKKQKIKSQQVAVDVYQFNIEQYQFQSNVKGDQLWVTKEVDSVPEIVQTFNLSSGVSISLVSNSDNESFLAIMYGSPGSDKANNQFPTTFREIKLFETISTIRFNPRNVSMDFAGIGSIDLITSDPVDLNLATVPFLKLFHWDPETKREVSLASNFESAIFLVVDYLTAFYVDLPEPGWVIRVFYKEFLPAVNSGKK